MKKNFLLALVLSFFCLGVVMYHTIPVFAVDLNAQIQGQLDSGAQGGGLGTAVDPREAIALMIKTFLGLLGTVFFVLIILSGYWLITARGSEDKEKKAIDTIRRAVIGLAVVLLAYGITAFVTSRVQKAVYGAPEAGRPPRSAGFDSRPWWCGFPGAGFASTCQR